MHKLFLFITMNFTAEIIVGKVITRMIPHHFTAGIIVENRITRIIPRINKNKKVVYSKFLIR